MRCRDRGAFSAVAISPDAIRIERRGGGATVIALFALRGELEQELDRTDLSVLAFSEEPRFGGVSTRAPIDGRRLELLGPAALVLEAPGT
jgi:maltooligosyltrehalose trehalohydrolase